MYLCIDFVLIHINMLFLAGKVTFFWILNNVIMFVVKPLFLLKPKISCAAVFSFFPPLEGRTNILFRKEEPLRGSRQIHLCEWHSLLSWGENEDSSLVWFGLGRDDTCIPGPLGSLPKWNPCTHSEWNLQAAALCGLQQSIWVEWTTFSACTSLLTVVTNSIKMETGAKMFMLLSVFLCPWHTQAALLYAQHLLRWSLLVLPHLHWWDYLPHIRACGLFV